MIARAVIANTGNNPTVILPSFLPYHNTFHLFVLLRYRFPSAHVLVILESHHLFPTLLSKDQKSRISQELVTFQPEGVGPETQIEGQAIDTQIRTIPHDDEYSKILMLSQLVVKGCPDGRVKGVLRDDGKKIRKGQFLGFSVAALSRSHAHNNCYLLHLPQRA